MAGTKINRDSEKTEPSFKSAGLKIRQAESRISPRETLLNR